MKRVLMTAAALCAMLVAPSLAEAAARGFATANVNMRSGPSTAYPAVSVVPVGAPVTIYGCMSSVNWCDVGFTGGRGWVSGNYVQTTYRSNRVYVEPDYYQGLGIPLVTFDVDRYWNSNYRNRDFYRDRDRWRRAPPPPPPRWTREDRRGPPDWDRGPPPRFDRDDDRRGPPPQFDRRDDRRGPPPQFDRGDDRRGNPPPQFDRRDDRRGDDRRGPPQGGDRRDDRAVQPSSNGEICQATGQGCGSLKSD